jgi:hypothetical protein
MGSYLTAQNTAMAVVTAARGGSQPDAEKSLEDYLRSVPARKREKALTDVLAAVLAYLVIVLDGSEDASEVFAGIVLDVARYDR